MLDEGAGPHWGEPTHANKSYGNCQRKLETKKTSTDCGEREEKNMKI